MKKTPIVCEDVTPAFPSYPVAVKAGELLFVSGLRPAGPAGFADLPEAGREQMQGYPLADLTEGRVVADSWAVHDSLKKSSSQRARTATRCCANTSGSATSATFPATNKYVCTGSRRPLPAADWALRT